MDVQLLSDMNGDTIPQNNEDRIFSILFNEDELTWQTIIYDLVKTEQMDPWNISIGTIAEKFLLMLNKMKEMDFRIGGKMVLAAALLVKIKSDKLMKEDFVALDNMISGIEDEFSLDDLHQYIDPSLRDRPALIPRTPQPRQRKVSVYDLVEALEKALESETKKQFKSYGNDAPVVKLPEKTSDMTAIITALHKKIKTKFSLSRIVTFDELLSGNEKEDKVLTFVPLLHLDNQRRIDLMQKEHFGQISIKLNKHKFADEAF